MAPCACLPRHVPLLATTTLFPLPTPFFTPNRFPPTLCTSAGAPWPPPGRASSLSCPPHFPFLRPAASTQVFCRLSQVQAPASFDVFDDAGMPAYSTVCTRVVNGTLAYVHKSLETDTDPVAEDYGWFWQQCLGPEFDEAPAEEDDLVLCCECREPPGQTEYFFKYYENDKSDAHNNGEEYCKQCFGKVKAERAAERKQNPIGHSVPLEEMTCISQGNVSALDCHTFVQKYQAQLIAFLEAELQPAFEAFQLSQAWQTFLPFVALPSGEEEENDADEMRHDGGGYSDDESGSDYEFTSRPKPAVCDENDGGCAEQQASDSYADYQPAKLDYGPPHVEHVVESASLGCVTPVDVTYKPSLPADLLSSGEVSRVQLEAVVYALQRRQKSFSKQVIWSRVFCSFLGVPPCTPPRIPTHRSMDLAASVTSARTSPPQARCRGYSSRQWFTHCRGTRSSCRMARGLASSLETAPVSARGARARQSSWRTSFSAAGGLSGLHVSTSRPPLPCLAPCAQGQQEELAARHERPLVRSPPAPFPSLPSLSSHSPPLPLSSHSLPLPS